MPRISLNTGSAAVALAIVTAGTLNADTLHVDDDGVQFPGAYTSIQAAVDAAQDGDTILVEPGTYTGLGPDLFVVNIESKSLNIVSTGGASETIIDGENSRKLIRCSGWESFSTTPSIAFDGFTMTNGNGDLPMQFLSYNANIDNSIVKNNSGDWAIIFFNYSLGKLSNTTIKNCSAVGNQNDSGIIIAMSSNLEIESCKIKGNTGGQNSSVVMNLNFGYISDTFFPAGPETVVITDSHFCDNQYNVLHSNSPVNNLGEPAYDVDNLTLFSDNCPELAVVAIKTHWPELWWWWMDIPVGPIQLEEDILESWSALRQAPNDHIAIVDSLSAKIVLFDGATGAYRSELSNPDVLLQPIDVAFAPAYGMTTVLDRFGGAKAFSSESGDFLFGMHDEFSRSLAMAVDPVGRVYMLTDNAETPIQVWHLDGGSYQYSLWDEDLEAPRTLTLDSEGRLYVLDGDGELFRFNSSGELEAKIQPRVGMELAIKIKVDSAGYVYMLDEAGVHRFNQEGEWLGLALHNDPADPIVDFMLTEEAPDIDTSIQGDLNGDGAVNGADMGLLLAAWGPAPAGASADLDSDAVVGGGDLGLLLANWTG